MTPALDISGAKSYALRLIKFRPRSEKEVREKLKLKDVDPAVLDQVVSFLKNSRLIDDGLFARLWVQGRIKKPLGMGRLRLELRQKGVDDRAIEDALDQAKEGYDEAAVIRAVIRKKTAQFKGLSGDKMKARIFAYLVRRGFSHERVIHEVIGGIE